jgi:putative transcriptional regulator
MSKMIKNRIKEYRARFDMKQEDLARLAGVRRETIGNLEKGKYNPSLVLAWNIAKAFGVTIEDVFTVEYSTDILIWQLFSTRQAAAGEFSKISDFIVEEAGQLVYNGWERAHPLRPSNKNGGITTCLPLF